MMAICKTYPRCRRRRQSVPFNWGNFSKQPRWWWERPFPAITDAWPCNPSMCGPLLVSFSSPDHAFQQRVLAIHSQLQRERAGRVSKHEPSGTQNSGGGNLQSPSLPGSYISSRLHPGLWWRHCAHRGCVSVSATTRSLFMTLGCRSISNIASLTLLSYTQSALTAPCNCEFGV